MMTVVMMIGKTEHYFNLYITVGHKKMRRKLVNLDANRHSVITAAIIFLLLLLALLSLLSLL